MECKSKAVEYLFFVFVAIAAIEGIVLSALIMERSWLGSFASVLVPLAICVIILMVAKRCSLRTIWEKQPLIGLVLCFVVGLGVLIFEKYTTPSWGIKPITGTIIMAMGSAFLVKKFDRGKASGLSVLLYLVVLMIFCALINFSVAGCAIAALSMVIITVLTIKRMSDWYERLWPITVLYAIFIVLISWLVIDPYSIFDWVRDEVVSPSIDLDSVNTMGSAIVRMLFRQTELFGPKHAIELALDMMPWSELLKNYVYEDGYLHVIAMNKYGYITAIFYLPYLGIIIFGALLVKRKSGLEFYCSLFAFLCLSFYIAAYIVQCWGICVVRVGEPLFGRDMVVNVFTMLSVIVITKRSDEYMPL